MRRLFAILIVLLVAGVVLPPLWFRAFPVEMPELPRGDRMLPVDDGVSVSAVVRGGGRPVVLVHGLPGSAHDWQPLTATLARRGHRVIAYDRVGYGHSDARPGAAYSVDESAGDLLGLLESQDLRDVTVVGWSYGGGTAIRAALADASRIGRLVLVGSAGPWPDAPEDPVVFKLLFSDPVMAWFASVPPLRRGLQAGFSGQAFGDEPMPDWWLPTLGANFAMPHTQRTYLEEGRVFAWSDDLDPAGIERPILVIHGDADRLVPLEVGRRLAERARHAELVVIEGGSHMLPITRTDELARYVATFTLVK